MSSLTIRRRTTTKALAPSNKDATKTDKIASQISLAKLKPKQVSNSPQSFSAFNAFLLFPDFFDDNVDIATEETPLLSSSDEDDEPTIKKIKIPSEKSTPEKAKNVARKTFQSTSSTKFTPRAISFDSFPKLGPWAPGMRD